MARSTLCRRLVGGGLAVALAVLGGPGAGTARADHDRTVSVNGVWLGPRDIAVADWHAGFRLPNGHYWCDPRDGLWGVVNGPALGRVAPSVCPPLPGSGGGSNLRRGPFGDTGGDGKCFYYLDPETGSSVMTGNC